ncbi:MAG: membrane protein insertion efficiency factor YidD [Candidatus Hydrogenedens sp.]|nr:membrane protein insertion efficiency factor YidD [Candidatus Hydrogenedens sp.]
MNRCSAAGVCSVGRLVVACIRLYQRFLSPLLGEHCRFYPSCSQYAAEAVQVHGVVRGLGYAAWRLFRCQPFCKGGHDPVPPRRARRGHGPGGGVTGADPSP